MRHPGNFFHNWSSRYPKDSGWFIVASLFNSVGGALLWPLTTIYVHNVLHRSYGEAGLVLFFQSAAGIIGQFTGGAMFNRLGAKKLIVGSLMLTGLAQLTLMIAKAWVPYIAAMTVLGFLVAVTRPAMNAFISFRWPDHKYQLFNAVYVSNNIGVAVGTSLAGILAMISFNLTFLFDGLSTLGFALFFYQFLRRIDDSRTAEWDVDSQLQSDDLGARYLIRQYRVYLFIALGSMMIWLANSSWNSGVAPYLNQQGLSPDRYSLLWTINGAIILLGQPVTSALNRFVTKSHAARLVGSACCYSLAFALMLVWHQTYVDLITGMVIATFGEMLISPTVPTIIAETTGRAAPFYLGLVGGSRNGGKLIGPLLFGNVFDMWGVTPVMLIAVSAALMGGLLLTVHSIITQRPRRRHAKACLPSTNSV